MKATKEAASARYLGFFATQQEEYILNFLLPSLSFVTMTKISDKREARKALNSPEIATRFALYYFAFARRGGERAGYGKLALRMFDSTKRQGLRSAWPTFQNLCKERGVGANEKVNRRPIEGLMQVYHLKHFGGGGLFAGIARRANSTGALGSTYVELITVAGLGEKISSFLLRDLVWIYDIEERVLRGDRMFLQPVDVWVRRTAEVVFMQRFPQRVPGLAVGNLVSEACCEARLSGIAFNQGAWVFGSQKVKNKSEYENRLKDCLDLATTSSTANS